MQRHLKVLIISSAFTLAACSSMKSNEGYPHSASSVPRMKTPSNIDASRFQTNYPVPTDINPATGQSPSITPPGSNMMQMNGQPTSDLNPSTLQQPTQQATQQQMPATQPQASTAAPQNYSDSITVNGEYAQAWQKVGAGIQRAGYKILDKDESMGSYYILNTQATQGKITKDTPIVQVHVERANNQTKIILLNEQNQPLNPALAAQIMQDLKSKGQL